MSHIYFHIGYPKSASTTLQKQLFNKHSELINLGLYPTNNVGSDTTISEFSNYTNDKNIKLFYDNLLKKNELNYQKSSNDKLRNKLLEQYKEENKSFIFSEERATSVFFTHPDIGLKANRIKSLFPNARIIIIVRNQIEAMTSMYADFPFDPRSFAIGDPIDIDKWVKIVLEDDFLFYKDMLDYNSVINYYHELFGIENVCVLPFEMLVKDIKNFSDAISNFMNINKEETLKLLSQRHENKRVSHRYNIARSLRKKYMPNVSVRNFLGEKITDKINIFLKDGK
jgi:hypothetical protein